MQSNKSEKFIFKLAVVLVLVVSLLGLSIYGTTKVLAADDKKDDDDGDSTFYRISSAASSFYDEANNGKGRDTLKANNGKNVNMCDAGLFVGYIDDDYDSGLFGATFSYLSAASQTRGYSSFKVCDGVNKYVQYGHALKNIGLDTTGNRKMSLPVLRVISGGLMVAAYTLSMIVDVLFYAILKILTLLNPFSWLKLTFDDGFQKWFGNTSDPPAIFVGLQGFVSNMYRYAQGLGLVIIVLSFLIGLAIALLFWKKTTTLGTTFRKFITRLIFLFVGIPLLGGLYTLALEGLMEQYNINDTAPTGNVVIASTFVDFESWAENTRLTLPSGCKIVLDTSGSTGGTVDLGKSTNVRAIARAINGTSSDITPAGSLSGNSVNSSFFATGSNGDGTLTAGKQKSVKAVYGLMNRYMGGTFYNASDFESAYKANITGDGEAGKEYNKTKKAFYEGIDLASNKDAYFSYSDGKVGDGKGPGVMGAGIKADALPYLKDGSRKAVVAEISGSTTTFTGAGSTGGRISWNSYDAKDNSKLSGTPTFGLSTMSMYNYLTTDFTDSDVIVYSLKKATSDFVVRAHHSVNLVGTGLAKFMYFLHALIILVFIGVLGILYAVAMIVNNIGRGIKMISAVPFAMLGSMRGMAKVVVYAVMMMIEIVGTLFVYTLAVDIFIGVQQIVETPIASALKSGANAKATVISPYLSTILPKGAETLSMTHNGVFMYDTIVVAFVIILDFILFFKMVKLRKVIVKTLEELSAGVIDRLFMTNGVAQQAAGARTFGDKAKGVAATGAGALAGAKGLQMMKDHDAKKNGNKGVPDIAGEGKDGKDGEGNGVVDPEGPNGRGPNDGSGEIEGADEQKAISKDEQKQLEAPEDEKDGKGQPKNVDAAGQELMNKDDLEKEGKPVEAGESGKAGDAKSGEAKDGEESAEASGGTKEVKADNTSNKKKKKNNKKKKGKKKNQQKKVQKSQDAQGKNVDADKSKGDSKTKAVKSGDSKKSVASDSDSTSEVKKTTKQIAKDGASAAASVANTTRSKNSRSTIAKNAVSDNKSGDTMKTAAMGVAAAALQNSDSAMLRAAGTTAQMGMMKNGMSAAGTRQVINKTVSAGQTVAEGAGVVAGTQKVVTNTVTSGQKVAQNAGKVAKSTVQVNEHVQTKSAPANADYSGGTVVQEVHETVKTANDGYASSSGQQDTVVEKTTTVVENKKYSLSNKQRKFVGNIVHNNPKFGEYLKSHPEAYDKMASMNNDSIKNFSNQVTGRVKKGKKK